MTSMVTIDDKKKHATKAMTHWIGISVWPNKSPEPTVVGAVSSAIAVHAASRRWLSFFR
jgi:hypothetical protein